MDGRATVGLRHVSVYLRVQVVIVYGRDRNSIAIHLQGHIAKSQVAFVQGNGRACLKTADADPNVARWRRYSYGVGDGRSQ